MAISEVFLQLVLRSQGVQSCVGCHWRASSLASALCCSARESEDTGGTLRRKGFFEDGRAALPLHRSHLRRSVFTIPNSHLQ